MSTIRPPAARIPVFIRCKDRFGVYVPSYPAVYDRGEWYIRSARRDWPLGADTTVLRWSERRSEVLPHHVETRRP